MRWNAAYPKLKIDLQNLPSRRRRRAARRLLRVGDDDTHPFLSAHIPVISIHSITQDIIRILHTPRDRIDAIHFDDYYAAYMLAAYYLAYLDVKTD